jgi:hypothetical protein
VWVFLFPYFVAGAHLLGQLLGPLIPQLTSPSVLISLDIPPIIAHNPTVATPLLVSLLTLPPSDASGAFLDVLTQLAPTLPTFDVIGRLLRDTTPATDSISGGKVTVADIVRMEVLGPLIHECILWLERAEREERDGLISDDRFAKGVQNVPSSISYTLRPLTLVFSSAAFLAHF